MASTNPGDYSVTSPADATGGSGEVLLRVSSEEQQTRTSRELQKVLNKIVYCIAVLEWAGNAVGTLASLWATVVLLGGFSTMLTHADFWFFTVMIFMESTRVFIRNDASVNQWLLGSTRAFRWDDFSFPHIHQHGCLIAVTIGVGIFLTPLGFLPEIIAGILKLALLAITSLLLTRRYWGKPVRLGITVLGAAAVCGGSYGSWKVAQIKSSHDLVAGLVFGLYFYSVIVGSVAYLAFVLMSHVQSTRKPVLVLCLKVIVASVLVCLPFQFIQAAVHPEYRSGFSIFVAPGLVALNYPDGYWERGNSSPETCEQETTTLLLGAWELFLKITDTVLPILFFWSVVFPLPGISMKVSFYMLLSVIAAVLVGNLQIPVAFLQVLLSILRLGSLLGHRHHDYRPLPDGASPNLVPSILVFYILELCQGSSYIMATVLGFLSFPRRRLLVRALGFTEEWGAKAVNLYYHQAYQGRSEKGLFPSEKYTPSITNFAFESLGCTSCETQIVGLHVLDNFLQHWDTQSKKELITEITFTSKKVVCALIDMLGSKVPDIRLLAARIVDELASSIRISELPGTVKLVCSLLVANNRQDSLPNQIPENSEGNLATHQRTLFSLLAMSILHGLACDSDNYVEISHDATTVITNIVVLIRSFDDEKNIDEKRKVYCSALRLVRSLVINSGKVGKRFRQELSEDPFLTNILERMLHLEDCEPEAVFDVIAKLALDETARQEIGSSQIIIGKLMRAFLRPDDGDVNSIANNGRPPLQMAAGEALANLTIMSTDNCWAILLAEAEPEHNLVGNLILMLDTQYWVIRYPRNSGRQSTVTWKYYNKGICVAANLLHNLCANSGDKLVELGKEHLESALRKVMNMIKTREGKQLEAALCVASQISYVIPEYCAQVLESANTNSAMALVETLLNTLRSIREPCLEYPRIRRVLVEVVISIVDLCPRYINLFREKRAKDALDMVKGTPSRLEKYRVFLGGEGVVAEILPMRDLVDKAKRLIQQGNSNSMCETRRPMNQL